MNARDKAILRKEGAAGVERLLREDAEKRARRLAKSLPRRRAAAVERKAERAASSFVREWVAGRAAGRCEACGGMWGAALHWDHFFGRARSESVESTWMLCPSCDREKTENVPTRIAWLERFQGHAIMHGYAEQEQKARAALELERAQHPEHR